MVWHVLRKALEFEVKARGSEDDQRRHGRHKQRRRARVLFWRSSWCLESSEMESGSWRDYLQSGVNLATSFYRDKPRSKLD